MPDPEEFYRIKRLPPYVFAEVNRLKAQCRARGMDVIDFGMGNSDMDTPAHIVDKLVETVRKPRTHRYSASKGIPGLRRAQAGYYARRFGVTLDPETQVIATLGSKGFSKILLREAEVAVSPGIGFGEYGEGYVRIGLVGNEQRIRQAARGVRRLMQRAGEIVLENSQSKETVA